MPRIFVLSGPNAGDRFEVAAGATFGRANECAVILRDASVSRLHARLDHDAGVWTVVDTGSRNGLFAGGKRVERAALLDGAEFTLGEVLLRFRAEPAAQTSSSTPTSGDQASAASRDVAPARDAGSGAASSSDSGRDVQSVSREAEPPRDHAPARSVEAPRVPAPRSFETPDVAPTAPRPIEAPRVAARPPVDDEIELEGAWDDVAAAAPAEDAPIQGTRPSAPLERARALPPAPQDVAPPVRPLGAAPLPRGTSSGIGARTAGAPTGVTGRDRGILQYHKVENRGGLLAAELGQQPLWVRTLVVVASLALFALVFWFVFRGTTLLKGERADDAGVEAPTTE